MADSLIGNHATPPMIGYVKNNLNLKLTDEQCEQLECELETIARESKNGNPIDQFTFDTTAQALSPWQDGNIVELNDAGEWFVNTPDIAFNDIGDLLDAEEAMFQEMHSCPSLLVSRAWSCATLSAWLLLLISTPVYCATLWALSYCAL
jgi:hypothetical protein